MVILLFYHSSFTGWDTIMKKNYHINYLVEVQESTGKVQERYDIFLIISFQRMTWFPTMFQRWPIICFHYELINFHIIDMFQLSINIIILIGSQIIPS